MKVASTAEIVCLGEPLLELVRAEHEAVGLHYRPGFGGDTSNAAIAAARQGASVGFLTGLGRDEFGGQILDLWRDEGVDCSRVKLSDSAPTGIYFVHPHESERHFTYYRAGSAASLYSSADLPADYIGQAKVLHVSAISQAISDCAADAVDSAIDIARAAGTKVSYDTNLRLKLWPLDKARETIHAAMSKADLAFPSYDDALELTGLSDVDAIIDFYLDLGAEIVALKLGEEGARIAVAGRRETIAPVAVSAVDSTGAGDAFAGGFLAYWLETGDPFEAGRRAAVVAAHTVAGFGAIAPIPHRDRIRPTGY